jgi:hypothetical protein
MNNQFNHSSDNHTNSQLASLSLRVRNYQYIWAQF